MSTTTTVLPSGAGAPSVAREHVRAACRGHLSAALVTDAELVVSELVTNAVVHGKEPVRVELALEAHTLVIGVSDQGRGFVGLPDPPGPAAPGGRGLRLVAELADTWQVSAPAGVGTVVRCVLSEGGHAAAD